jgi:hypothetical protein
MSDRLLDEPAPIIHGVLLQSRIRSCDKAVGRLARNAARDFATNCHEYCGLVGTFSKGKKCGLLVRCEETVDEGVLC